MPQIKFDTGIVDFVLNDTVTVSFNPTDMAFIAKIFNAFDALDEKQEEYRKQLVNADGMDAFKIANQMDAEQREIINTVFGFDICTGLFGKMHVYAAGDGLPAWCNLLLCLIDQMDEAFTAEKQKTNPRLQKYISKYHK